MESNKLFCTMKDYFYGDESVNTHELEDELIKSEIDVELVWELLDELLENIVMTAIRDQS